MTAATARAHRKKVTCPRRRRRDRHLAAGDKPFAHMPYPKSMDELDAKIRAYQARGTAGSAGSIKNRREKRLHLQLPRIEQRRLEANAEIEQSTAENKQSVKDVEAACGRLCAGARGISASADQARVQQERERRELVVQRAEIRRERDRREQQEQQQRRERQEWQEQVQKKSSHAGWTEYIMSNGRSYFYNTETSDTTWVKPREFVEAENEELRRRDEEHSPQFSPWR